MSDQKLNSEHLSKRDIKGYLHSELSDKDMHRIERHLLICEFCSEAIEGYEALPSIDVEFEVNELNDRIAQRIDKKEKRSKFPILRIAAIAIVLIISSIFITNYFIKDIRQVKLTEKRKSLTKEKSLDKDSIQTSKSFEKPESIKTQSEEKALVNKPLLKSEDTISEMVTEQSDAEESKDDFMISEVDEEMEEIPVIEFTIELDKTDKMNLSAPMQSIERSAKKESSGFAEQKTIQNEEVLENTSYTMSSADEINASSGVVAGAEIMVNNEIKNLNAQPSIGFDAYKLYLKENIRIPDEAIKNEIRGKVVLQFELDSLGNMSHFIIEKSLGYGCDIEAIRLIKEGPAWNAALKEGQKIMQLVKVKISFK